jgi:hypothetical protein
MDLQEILRICYERQTNNLKVDSSAKKLKEKYKNQV